MLGCQNLTRCYGSVRAVDNISMMFDQGASYCIYGKSGSGKTTWLKLLAGLETPTSGQVIRSDPSRLSMVFQQDCLLDHLSAYENIAYGLPYSEHQDLKEKVERSARLCACQDYLQQTCRTLSGGQRQRVALARALIKEPDVLLMDEPFAHMDPNLKYALLYQLKELQKTLRFTLIFVSHDINEAINAADTILFLQAGKLLQKGTLKELMDHPASIQVARGFSYPGMNIFPAGSGYEGFYPDAVLEGGQDGMNFSGSQILWSSRFQNGWLSELQADGQKILVFWKDRVLPERLGVKKSSIFRFDAAGNLTESPSQEFS